MRRLSNEFRQKAKKDTNAYIAYADITLTNGTVLNLSNSEIWNNGFSGEDAVGSDTNFDALGSAFVQSFDLIINNIYETYSQYTFEGAKVVITVGMELPYNDTTRIETHKLGTYTVDSTSYNGATIHLYLLDNMSKFDKEYKTTLTYPATLAQILRDACANCNVLLNTQQFNNSSIVIDSKPENTTFREVVSWVATIAGCFAKCNADGQLELKWFDDTALDNALSNILDGGTFNPWSAGDTYDGGTFNPWSTGTEYDEGTFNAVDSVHYISALFSQNISVDDTVIAGVKIEVEDGNGHKIVYPNTEQSGYIVTISGNEFITEDNVNTILTFLQTLLTGLTFRKLEVNQVTDFSIEAGDVAIVFDRKGNLYRALVTRATFSVSSTQTIVSGAETPLRNSAFQLSQSVKTLATAEKLVGEERGIREQLYEDLSDRLDEKAGLYFHGETTQTGTIYYLMDQPNLADSTVVWKMTKDAFGVSTDGGETWNAGLTVDGNLLTSIISTIGLFFDYAHGGTLTLGGQNNTSGILHVVNEENVLVGVFDKDGLLITLPATVHGNPQSQRGVKITDGNIAFGFIENGVFKPDVTYTNTIYGHGMLGSNGQAIALVTYSYNGIGGEDAGLINLVPKKNSGDTSIYHVFIVGNTELSGKLYITDIAYPGDERGLTIESAPNWVETEASTPSSGVHFDADNGYWIVFQTHDSQGTAGPRISLAPDGYSSSYKPINFSDDTLIDGSLYVNNTIYGTVATSSDERLKNIGVWDDNLDKFLLDLTPITFSWKNDDTNTVHPGLGAQTVKQVLDAYNLSNTNIVIHDFVDDRYSINYTELIPVLIHKVQTLNNENKTLKKRLVAVENRLQKLEELVYGSATI